MTRYAVLLERLFRSRRFGVELGVERLEAVLAEMGHPHRRIPRRVTIAGTNGKGSTAAFLESILAAAGHRTGLFSSPHLSRFAERFRVAGACSSDDEIAAAAERVSAAGGDSLTFFEQCTAIALQLFADAGVEIGIFEVGLGGRLDATRVVGAELVVVTGVAYDHQDVLGDSLEAIAREKVGAADADATLIIGRGGAPGAGAALREAAREHRATDVRWVVGDAAEELGLAGPFQQVNAATAIAAARALGIVDDRVIAAGLRDAHLAGRFERLELGASEIILDGAHNGDGALALAAAMATLAPAPTLGVVGLSSGKDVDAVLAPMLPRLDELWVTRGSSDRALDPARVREAVGALAPGLPCAVVDLEAALERIAGGQRRVLVFGSLLMVGEVRRRLLGEPGDPMDLSDPATGRK